MSVMRVSGPAVAALLVALIAAAPLFFVMYRSAGLSGADWAALWSVRLPRLMWNTFWLAALVALGSLLLGVSAAWLVARRRFVGRRLAIWLMVLPLTVPTYVFAHIYTTLLEADGWLGRLWAYLFGPAASVPDLYNVAGVAVILSLAGFSYVFLLVQAALAHSSRTLEEAARVHGAGPHQVFWKVNLPLLRPAIAAGLALVVLHVLSDFGAVSMLRYQTFTLSIYLQLSGRFDYAAAAGLSLVLVGLSLTFLIVERFFRRRQRYYASGARARQNDRKPARPLEQLLVWSWLGLLATLSFGLPLAWMVSWSWRALAAGAVDARFWGYVTNSLLVAASVATIALLVALPVALYHARRHTLLSQLCLQASSVGFVLPGPVIALGVLSLVLSLLPVVYGTALALVLGLTIRFLPLAVQSQEASLQQLTPSIEHAGRVLGARPLENLLRVVLPVIRGGLIGGWVLVFIDALKELPATLLLRPTGFDTLPVRIWIEASEEMLEQAAPAALMLVLGTLPAIWLLVRDRRAGPSAPQEL
ncbi:MAG: iron ABC transporter permease [Gammaproteobacteria bacterium]|nr:iron ABC transporter permease [Gammaproteobacteria bacterium]NIR98421.1 iron ABC transporter permease [Gammaproteobacteria bacterium]NIT64168.1 iron ABC transporter permease [Gammaproteobacteria bacterium]NIV21108.1 ABC transporter permease subunit [Gammaproteobacteria bacterium]NIX10585.1 ABC transporter permease subunit [Gammaproteobacteria bacterium]